MESHEALRTAPDCSTFLGPPARTLNGGPPELSSLRRVSAHPVQRCLRFEEGQQIGVELVLVRVGQTMGAARIDLQRRVLDEFRREHG